MLAMYYTLRANELDPDEICVLAQHVQGAFAYQKQNMQHHPYYQQHHHSTTKSTSTIANNDVASTNDNTTAVTSGVVVVAPSLASTTNTQNAPMLDSYTLQLLWLIGSGAPFNNCYLDSSECILWPKQDAKLLKLLVDAGAKLSEKSAGAGGDDDEEDCGKNALVTSSQVGFTDCGFAFFLRAAP